MVKPTFLILIFSIFISVFTNAEADWVNPNDLELSFLPDSFFAGYLKADDDTQFFYSYHPSQNNQRKDPVVIWFGSGPGCSSLYSMFYSKGPFIFTRNTTEFKTNNFAWNKRANVVFIQSPGEVGFSTGQFNVTDDDMANLHLSAVLSFFAKFIDLKDQDLYLAGEGYAGIYIPYLARRIRRHNSDPLTTPDQHILLKGLFLGNPCTTDRDCQLSTHYNHYSYQYLYNHYFYSEQEYLKYNACKGIQTDDCQKVREELDNKFHLTGVDRKNIFAQCLEQKTEDYPNIPCLDQIGILKYLNRPSIQKVLHANISEESKWTICNQKVVKTYNRSSIGSYHLYPELIHDYRITIYSGALDASNPISGTISWIEELRQHLGLATSKKWSVWEMNGINGGDLWKINRLTFVSVRSAGHMVFTDQPELGYHVYESFLNNTM